MQVQRGSEEVASWHGVYAVWLDQAGICKKVCMKSAIDCKDRQDPSLVYDVSKLHIILNEVEEATTFLSLYLEMVMFMFEAFLEHELD